MLNIRYLKNVRRLYLNAEFSILYFSSNSLHVQEVIYYNTDHYDYLTLTVRLLRIWAQLFKANDVVS